MTALESLGSPFFRYGAFPLLSAASGILLKCVTRNDVYAFFKKEDMAVGPQLMLTAILTYVVLATDRARELVIANEKIADALKSNAPDLVNISKLQTDAYAKSENLSSAAWILLVLIFGLWSVTTIVKRWGWANEVQLMPTMGIGLPLALGIATLTYVMTAAAQ